jgi:hypothetical protein
MALFLPSHFESRLGCPHIHTRILPRPSSWVGRYSVPAPVANRRAIWHRHGRGERARGLASANSAAMPAYAFCGSPPGVRCAGPVCLTGGAPRPPREHPAGGYRPEHLGQCYGPGELTPSGAYRRVLWREPDRIGSLKLRASAMRANVKTRT